jgi:hypothetical protein
MFYRLEVAPVGTEAWGGIGGQGTQQVVNGQLGVWDSASVPDGRYTIRLRVVDPTSNYCEAFVTNVVVQNSAPPPPIAVESPVPTETEAPPIQNAVPTQGPPTVEGVPTTDPAGPTADPAAPAVPTPLPGQATFTPAARTATPRQTAGPSRTPTADGPAAGLGIDFDFTGLVDVVSDFFSGLARTFAFGIIAMAALMFLVGVIFFVRRVL